MTLFTLGWIFNVVLSVVLILSCIPYWCKAARPVGAWALDETNEVSDLSGNCNHGAAYGTTYDLGPTGEANGATWFSGNSSAFVEIPNNGKLEVRSFTFMTWIKQVSEGDSGTRGPYFEYNRSASANTTITQYGTNIWRYYDTGFFIELFDEQGSVIGEMKSSPTPSKPLPMDRWFLLSVTYDSKTGNLSLYNNRSLIMAKSLKETRDKAHYTKSNVRIGKSFREDKQSRVFKASMYCVQLYDTTLSVDEILEQANFCKKVSQCQPKLKLEKFNYLRKMNSCLKERHLRNRYIASSLSHCAMLCSQESYPPCLTFNYVSPERACETSIMPANQLQDHDFETRNACRAYQLWDGSDTCHSHYVQCP